MRQLKKQRLETTGSLLGSSTSPLQKKTKKREELCPVEFCNSEAEAGQDDKKPENISEKSEVDDSSSESECETRTTTWFHGLVDEQGTETADEDLNRTSSSSSGEENNEEIRRVIKTKKSCSSSKGRGHRIGQRRSNKINLNILGRRVSDVKEEDEDVEKVISAFCAATGSVPNVDVSDSEGNDDDEEGSALPYCCLQLQGPCFDPDTELARVLGRDVRFYDGNDFNGDRNNINNIPLRRGGAVRTIYPKWMQPHGTLGDILARKEFIRFSDGWDPSKEVYYNCSVSTCGICTADSETGISKWTDLYSGSQEAENNKWKKTRRFVFTPTDRNLDLFRDLQAIVQSADPYMMEAFISKFKYHPVACLQMAVSRSLSGDFDLSYKLVGQVMDLFQINFGRIFNPIYTNRLKRNSAEVSLESFTLLFPILNQSVSKSMDEIQKNLNKLMDHDLSTAAEIQQTSLSLRQTLKMGSFSSALFLNAVLTFAKKLMARGNIRTSLEFFKLLLSLTLDQDPTHALLHIPKIAARIDYEHEYLRLFDKIFIKQFLPFLTISLPATTEQMNWMSNAHNLLTKITKKNKKNTENKSGTKNENDNYSIDDENKLFNSPDIKKLTKLKNQSQEIEMIDFENNKNEKKQNKISVDLFSNSLSPPGLSVLFPQYQFWKVHSSLSVIKRKDWTRHFITQKDLLTPKTFLKHINIEMKNSFPIPITKNKINNKNKNVLFGSDVPFLLPTRSSTYCRMALLDTLTMLLLYPQIVALMALPLPDGQAEFWSNSIASSNSVPSSILSQIIISSKSKDHENEKSKDEHSLLVSLSDVMAEWSSHQLECLVVQASSHWDDPDIRNLILIAGDCLFKLMKEGDMTINGKSKNVNIEETTQSENLILSISGIDIIIKINNNNNNLSYSFFSLHLISCLVSILSFDLLPFFSRYAPGVQLPSEFHPSEHSSVLSPSLQISSPECCSNLVVSASQIRLQNPFVRIWTDFRNRTRFLNVVRSSSVFIFFHSFLPWAVPDITGTRSPGFSVPSFILFCVNSVSSKLFSLIRRR